MTHTLYCHHCNGPLSATDEYIAQYGGQATVCPHCRQPFPIPAAAAEVAQAGAAPQGPAVLPYATARVAGAQQNVIGFDGVGLVMAKGLVAPDRCVKCNAPGDGRRVVKMMYRHHPALFILILVP
jgi:hypothetical protein